MKVITEKATFEFPDDTQVHFGAPKRDLVLVTSAGKNWWFTLADVIAIIPSSLPDEHHATIWASGKIERGPKSGVPKQQLAPTPPSTRDDFATKLMAICGND